MSKSDVGTYGEDFGTPFQDHILAVLARTPTAIGRYRSALDYKFFVSESARLVAKTLFAHYDEHQRVPTQSLLIEEVKATTSEEKMTKADKLIRKMYKDDISDSDAVLKKTVEFGKQQAMVNAVIESADAIKAGKRNLVMPKIHEAQLVGEDLLDVGIHYNEDGLRSSWYTAARVLDTIPTGIAHLDYALGGGLGRGELGVVLAPPKRGKTTTLINFGFGALIAAVSAGFNVAHYSLEMNDKKIAIRYDDRLAGKTVSYKKSDPERYQATLDERARKFIRGQLFIKSYPTRSATPSKIRSHLTMLAAQGVNIDLVIVDYADIMRAERRLGDMRHEQAGIYEDLRGIAGEFDAAMWTASQTSKSALEKETVNMGDFAESFEKAAVMDVGVAFSQTDDEKIDSECRLYLMGVRDAEDNRTVRCTVRRDRCLLKSIRLVDAQGTPISTPHDDEDADFDSDTTKAKASNTADKVKRAAGIKKAARRRGAGKPGDKKGMKKGARRRKPSKVVPSV